MRKVLLGIAAVLAGAYLAGVWWFSAHWVPGATVNGLDVSNMSDDEVKAAVEDEASAWKAMLTSPDGFSLDLDAAGVGLVVDGGSVAVAAREGVNAWTWPLALVEPPAVEVVDVLSFDEDSLAELVNEAVAAYDEGAEPPSDAKLDYDAAAGAYVIAPEELGTMLDAEAVLAAAKGLVSSLGDSLELGEGALVQVSVAADDEGIVGARDAANAYLAHGISLAWEGEELAHADAGVICDWVLIDDDFAVALDADALRVWVDEACSDTVRHQDDLHYYALDLDQACIDLLGVLEGNAGEATVELASEVVQDKPPLSEGADKRGRHLDVNLSTQYARFYDGSGRIIWESYIVSGNLATDHGTPTGDFSILRKQRSRTLVGADEDGDGEPDYESYVDYWMLFREGGYGLHDASWRTFFGGEIYTYDGSHGCVNLPPARAAELYGIVNVGDRVYVHW